MAEWRSACCNPFKKSGHAAKKKNLRPVTKRMREEHPQFNLSVESRICDNCRKQLARTVSTHEEISSDSSTSSPVPVEFDKVERLESLQLVSKCLQDMGETPITKRRARSKRYTRDKVSRITALMDKAAITGEKAGDDREIIEQLKEVPQHY